MKNAFKRFLKYGLYNLLVLTWIGSCGYGKFNNDERFNRLGEFCFFVLLIGGATLSFGDFDSQIQIGGENNSQTKTKKRLDK